MTLAYYCKDIVATFLPQCATLVCGDSFDDHYQLQLRGDPDEDGEKSDEPYEDINLRELRYSGKSLADSDELPDGYVHLVKNKENKENSNTEDADKKETRRLNEYG